MPSKKKKYNARFPAGRIKKIMQTDEEVGKVAQAVPVIIYIFPISVPRTLELFVESLLTKTMKITNARNAKTLSPSHMKQCIASESRFDFLRDLVKNIPDIGANEELSGSEAGYGNEGTSPASTSTSSSNGGGLGGALPYEVSTQVAGSFQRSESYSPGTTTVSTATKRGFPGPGGSLNFYKEIPLEESTDSPPPPKLTRLNSAPASSAVPAIPFKIDILPSIDSSTVSAVDPVIKLDYSNLKLPTVATGTVTAATTNPTKAAAQPTVKIDLRLVTVTAPAKQHVPSTIVTRTTERQQHQPTNVGTVCVSPGGAIGSSTTSSFSTSAQSIPTTPVLPSPGPTTAPPIFSALSSTIPGMDEDYDDI